MEEKKGVGLSVASMVLGICAIVFGCCFWYLEIPLAIVGLILGAVSLKNKNAGKGMAIAGVVCSIVSLVPTIISIIAGAALMSSLGL